jgi:hypothetical protein
MTDRRRLSLRFSEPATDAPVPDKPGGRRPLPVEQGADFRQPPAETAAVPAPRHPAGTSTKPKAGIAHAPRLLCPMM